MGYPIINPMPHPTPLPTEDLKLGDIIEIIDPIALMLPPADKGARGIATKPDSTLPGFWAVDWVSASLQHYSAALKGAKILDPQTICECGGLHNKEYAIVSGLPLSDLEPRIVGARWSFTCSRTIVKVGTTDWEAAQAVWAAIEAFRSKMAAILGGTMGELVKAPMLPPTCPWCGSRDHCPDGADLRRQLIAYGEASYSGAAECNHREVILQHRLLNGEHDTPEARAAVNRWVLARDAAGAAADRAQKAAAFAARQNAFRPPPEPPKPRDPWDWDPDNAEGI